MFILVITGKKDTGKTSAITNVTKKIRNNSKNITDLLATTNGRKLNMNGGIPDCFEIIEKSNYKVGILSAGDIFDDFKSCITDLLKSKPDIIICAARKYTTPSILDEIKASHQLKSAEYIDIEKEKLNTIKLIENRICNILSANSYQSIL